MKRAKLIACLFALVVCLLLLFPAFPRDKQPSAISCERKIHLMTKHLSAEKCGQNGKIRPDMSYIVIEGDLP